MKDKNPAYGRPLNLLRYAESDTKIKKKKNHCLIKIYQKKIGKVTGLPNFWVAKTVCKFNIGPNQIEVNKCAKLKQE